MTTKKKATKGKKKNLPVKVEKKKTEQKEIPKPETEKKKEEKVSDDFRKNFELKKVKILKGNRGLEIDYSMMKMDGSLHSNEKISIESHFMPHPDLTDAIKKLSPFATESAGLLKYDSSIENDSVREEVRGKINSDYSPTGIAISGVDHTRGAIITGKFNCYDGYEIALNSPRITLSHDQFQFETELEELISTIENEVFDYLFNGKKAQLSLMNEFEEAEKEEKKKPKKEIKMIGETPIEEEEEHNPNQLEIDHE